jgi:hypothetical protein
MNKRRKAASIAFTGTTALTAIGLAPGHAHAAGVSKVTVTPGGHYTAKTISSPTLTQGTNTLKCRVGTASGSLAGNSTGSKVGSVSQAAFTSCAVDGIHFMCHLKKPVTIVPISPTMGGITRGEIKSISLQCSVSTPPFSTCRMTFTGSLSVSYSNTRGLLTIDPLGRKTLNTMGVTAGCQGLLTDGTDNAGVTAVYAVTPKQTISAT